MRNKALIVRENTSVDETLNSVAGNFKSSIKWIYPLPGYKGTNDSNGHPLILVYTDSGFPETSWKELFQIINSQLPDYKILLLMPGHQPEISGFLSRQGIYGMYLKSADAYALVENVKKVLEDAEGQVSGIEEKKKSDCCKGIKPCLTKRELEILSLISEGLTNHEIACKLFISCSTVDSHRKNLLFKFNVHNTAHLIKMAVSLGILN